MKRPEAAPFFALSPAAWRWAGAAGAVWAVATAAVYAAGIHGPLVPFSAAFAFFPPFYEMTGAALSKFAAPSAGAALFIAVSWGAGRTLLTRFASYKELNGPERGAFSFALGAGLLAAGMAALSFAGFLRGAWVFSFTALLAAWGAAGFLPIFSRGAAPAGPRFSALFSEGSLLPAALVALILGVTAFYAFSPEAFYDSLVYHLALPARFKAEGALVATPTNLYSGVPMTMEMLYSWALFVGDEVLAKLLHFSTGLALAAAFLGAGLRRKRPSTGWWACVVFFSTPMAALSAFRTGVDVASALFVFLAAYALALSVRAESPAPGSFRTLSALCLGLALGVKYTNWPALAVMLATLALLKAPPRALLRYAAVAGLCVAPWVLKNVVQHGNPLFPYFDRLFNPSAAYPVDWLGLHRDGWGRDWGALLKSPKALAETLLHPLFMTFRGGSDMDFVGPLFLCGLPLLAAFRPATAEGRAWGWMSLGLWLAWWPLTAMPRFFMPGLALLSLWIAVGAEHLPPGWRRTSAWAGIFLLALNNFAWTLATWGGFGAWDYLLKEQTKGAYLSTTHVSYTTPYFPSAAWINGHAPAGARVLMVGEARSYYVERPCLASSVWDTDLFTAWLKGAATEEDLWRRLKAEKVDYLLVNVAEAIRRRMAGLDGAEVMRMDRFFRTYARETFRDFKQDPNDFRWSIVYEISPAPAANGEACPLVEWYARQIQEHTSGGTR